MGVQVLPQVRHLAQQRTSLCLTQPWAVPNIGSALGPSKESINLATLASSLTQAATVATTQAHPIVKHPPRVSQAPRLSLPLVAPQAHRQAQPHQRPLVSIVANCAQMSTGA